MDDPLKIQDEQYWAALEEYCHNLPLARLGINLVFDGNTLVRGKLPPRPIHPFCEKRQITIDTKRMELDAQLRIEGDDTSMFLDFEAATEGSK